MPAQMACDRTQVKYSCRVCSHDCLMEQEAILCNGCQAWLHIDCMKMSHDVYNKCGEN